LKDQVRTGLGLIRPSRAPDQRINARICRGSKYNDIGDECLGVRTGLFGITIEFRCVLVRDRCRQANLTYHDGPIELTIMRRANNLE
jgi:hypothetical protein